MTALFPFVTVPMMHRRWPTANDHVPNLIEGIVSTAANVFERYGLKTPLVVAHALAQFSEEAGQGTEMLENMNYTAVGLRRTFPTHFTNATAKKYARNPRMIADIAYGGRMGNNPFPSDDGWNYRGAGLSQVTGREGFEKLQKKLDAMNAGFNILENPSLIIDPLYTLECGVADWINCGCLPHAEKDDIVGETHALNGGLNGLAERRRQLKLWKVELL